MGRGRLAGVAVLAVTGAAVGVLPALGADQSVDATVFNRFSQPTVTINVGETVTWHNRGGFHNVAFDDRGLRNEPSSSPWTATRTFTTPGTYTYHCEIHQSAGMVGTVVVQGTGASTPPPSTPPPSAGTPAPAPAPAPRRHQRHRHQKHVRRHHQRVA